MNMNIDAEKKIVELLDQLETNAKDIFVREEVNKKRGNYSLTELPADLAIEHTIRLIRTRLIQEGVLPEEY